MFRAMVREDGVTFSGEGRGIEYRNGEFRVTEAKPPKAMPVRGTGPSVREGTRTWFGKSFYAGEGHTGTGGFGFRDAATGESKLFTPPEVVDWSVSAMAVEPEAVWMTLVRRGEWGDQSGGLLRYDRATGTVRKSPFADLAHGLAVAGGRVFAATEFGVAVVEGDSVRRYFLDQTLAGRWRVVEAVR